MNTKLADNTVSYMHALNAPDNRAFVKLFAKVLEVFAEELATNVRKMDLSNVDAYKEECWISALKRSDVVDDDEELQMILDTTLDMHGAFPMEPAGYNEEPRDELVEASLLERCVSYASRYYMVQGSSFLASFANWALVYNDINVVLDFAMNEFAGRRAWHSVANVTQLQHDLLWR